MSLTIGILGGSFNPSHEGHVHISETLRKRLGLDAVWWLVSPQNPLKSRDEMAEYAVRLSHAQAVAAPYPKIQVSDFEAREGLQYTLDTLRRLKGRYAHKGYQFVWIMGADNLAGLHRWRGWQQILDEMPVVIADRRPFAHGALRSKAAHYLRSGRAAMPWQFVFLKPHAASGTNLRKKLGKDAFMRHNGENSNH